VVNKSAVQKRTYEKQQADLD